jgi:hypothetical protein
LKVELPNILKLLPKVLGWKHLILLNNNSDQIQKLLEKNRFKKTIWRLCFTPYSSKTSSHFFRNRSFLWRYC